MHFSSRFSGNVLLAATALSAAGLLVAAPGGKGAPPADAAAAKVPRERSAAPAASPAKVPLAEALARPASLHFHEMPLKDVAAKIAREQKINVLLNDKALTDAGVPAETPITFDSDGVPLGAALRFMLREHDLNFVTRDDDDDGDALVITSEEVAKERLKVRVYKVSEFMEPANEFTHQSSGSDEIIELITSTVAPTTWDSAGGAGSVSPFGETLVISQTDEVHEQIAGVFAALGTVRRRQQRELFSEAACVAPAPILAADEKIRRQLEARVDVHFHDAKLKDVVQWLRGLGIPALLDHKALSDAGLSDDKSISFDMAQGSLGRALKWLLRGIDAGYYIDHGALLITTDDRLKEHVIVVMYPVGDLIYKSADDAANGQPDFDTLIELITTAVAPASWDSAGGAGSIAPLESAKALVLAQTAEVHEQIARLLAKVRAGKKARDPAGGLMTIDENKPSLHVYILPVSLQTDGKLPSDEDEAKLADHYLEAIETLIDPGPGGWEAGDLYIQAFPDRIVVRQTPAIQRKIGDLLNAFQPRAPLLGPGNSGSFGAAAGFGGAF